MGPLGWQETVFIFVLALLIFGPKKLPELGKTIGKAVTEFRRASSELRSTWDREMVNLEREVEPIKEAADGAIGTYDEYLSSLSCDTSSSDPLESPVEAAANLDAGTGDLPAPDVAAAEPEGEAQSPDADTLVAESGEPEQPAEPAEHVADDASTTANPAAG